MSPRTRHDGEWLIERSRFIFRLYDVNTDALIDLAEFSLLVRDLLEAKTSAPVSDTTVNEMTQRLFSCADGFSEDAFIFIVGHDLSPLFRLDAGHSLLSFPTFEFRKWLCRFDNHGRLEPIVVPKNLIVINVCLENFCFHLCIHSAALAFERSRLELHCLYLR